jgi:hypothetical protein
MPKTKKNAKARATRQTPSDDPVQLTGKRAEFLSLPASVRSLIEGERLPRLRRMRKAVEADAGLPMPPVRVEPWGWVSPKDSVMPSVMFGKAGPIALGNNHFQWGAIFPASTLFVITDDAVLRRLLCHEFAHCFCYYARLLTGLADDICWESDEGSPFEEQLVEHIARDHEGLIDPAAWFGEWDARTFMQTNHQDLVGPSRAFQERWVGAGFPVRKASFCVVNCICPVEMPEQVGRRVQVVRIRAVGDLHVSIEIPEEVARRALQVASNTGPRPQVPPALKPQ